MELIVNIFVAAGFSFIVIYQSLYLANNHHVLFWLNAVQVLLSSYSLISHAIPESTPYSSDDSFNLISHLFSRHIWVILFGIPFVLIAEMNKHGSEF